MLWGIASHKASLKDPKKKAVPLLIPYGRFTKMIIYYLGSTSDVHKRPESPCHLPGDDFLLEAAAPKGDKDQGEVDSSRVTSGVSIPVSTQAHEALAGPDPEPMQEDQTGSDSGKVHVSLAGPNPEHMDDEFLATAYPKVHENLKLITDERVIEDNPESHSGSMSSMKNLEDTDNFGDQFITTFTTNIRTTAEQFNPVAIVASRAVDPVGSPSSTTIDQDEQSSSTSPTNQEIQSQVTHQDSAHPFESPLAGKTDITFTRRRVPSNWLIKMKFNGS
ncbi:hypothetical protein Tco_0550225, partial [Tanacetum coccineum]